MDQLYLSAKSARIYRPLMQLVSSASVKWKSKEPIKKPQRWIEITLWQLLKKLDEKINC